MPIYDIFEQAQQRKGGCGVESDRGSFSLSELTLKKGGERLYEKGNLFAAVGARLFFAVLLATDLMWGGVTALCLVIALLGHGLTLCTSHRLRTFVARRYLNLKRSAICAVALVVALFAPALGMMIACSYFLMYDKKGVQEVVPSILQDQFQEFFTL